MKAYASLSMLAWVTGGERRDGPKPAPAGSRPPAQQNRINLPTGTPVSHRPYDPHMRVSQVLRSLARMPGFTGVAVLTLAIGIGANTAIFSVIEGVLLKPLPYPRSDELVVARSRRARRQPRRAPAPRRSCTSPIARTAACSRTSGSGTPAPSSVTGLAEPEEVRTLFVTDGVLPMLGVQPMLGRLFSRADDTPGRPETVVLTAGYWRSKFGGDPSAIGRTLMLDGQPREIIGVLPDSFRFLDRDVSLVLPFRFDRSKVFLGQFSYHGARAAEAGRDDRAGQRRRRAADSRSRSRGSRRFPAAASRCSRRRGSRRTCAR